MGQALQKGACNLDLVGRTPRSARDPLVPLFELSADSHQADEGVGRGPGVRPTRLINIDLIKIARPMESVKSAG